MPPRGSGLPVRLHDAVHGSDRGQGALLRSWPTEYSNIAEIVTLPYKTNGYQRKAQANMAGSTTPGGTPTAPGSTPPGSQTGATVVLTARAWGHEGGNLITAEFLNPGVAERTAHGRHDRERPLGQPRHQRDRRSREHGRPGGRGDQRARGREREARRAHVPRQRRRRHRAGPAEGEPVRLPERPAPRAARSVRAQSSCASASGATARTPASSCTASSTPASGRRR